MGNNGEADNETSRQEERVEETGKKYWPGVRRLSEVQEKSLRWWWYPYLVRDKANVLEGDPGLGKSLLIALLAGRDTKGQRMEYDSRPGWALGHPDADDRDSDPGGTLLLLAGEDDTADTILPRVRVAGGDVSRVIVLEKVPYQDARGVTRYRRPRFPSDTQAVLRVVRGEHVRLVMVDPITSFLDKDVSPNADTEMRQAMDPLVDGCATEHCATLFTRHLNKSTGQSAIHRGSGTMGIAGLARSVIMIAQDPDAPEGVEQFVLAHVKANLAKLGQTLVFHKLVPIGTGDTFPVIDWKGTSLRTANDVYRALEQKRAGLVGEQHSERMAHQVSDRVLKAAEWLKGEFEETGDEGLPAESLIARGVVAGHSEKSLRRAAHYLKVRISREGFQGPSFWYYDPSVGREGDEGGDE